MQFSMRLDIGRRDGKELSHTQRTHRLAPTWVKNDSMEEGSFLFDVLALLLKLDGFSQSKGNGSRTEKRKIFLLEKRLIAREGE